VDMNPLFNIVELLLCHGETYFTCIEPFREFSVTRCKLVLFRSHSAGLIDKSAFSLKNHLSTLYSLLQLLFSRFLRSCVYS